MSDHNAFLAIFENADGKQICMFEAYFRDGEPATPIHDKSPLTRKGLSHAFDGLKVYSHTVKRKPCGGGLQLFTGLCRVPAAFSSVGRANDASGVTGSPEMADLFLAEIGVLPHRKLTYRHLSMPRG
ncbi:hypothetical protein LXA47_31260 [Massilia sp. P8910]|uniref:hypothetical protein n=1 Tax=Massilia antarctica TaxID=2765360 RepID=UPI001E600C93|nr:hypothetical protein [Massilia antarctica]MCE3608050.1 hypothetical protein [Massilia antarctica]